jgi:hypothetical protein
MIQGSDFLYDFLCRHADWYPEEMLNAAHRARGRIES